MKKQWITIGMAGIVLLSGCTVNVTKNVTEQPSSEPIPVQTVSPTPDWKTETAPASGEFHHIPEEHILGNVHLTNVEEYVVNTVRPIYYGITENPHLTPVIEGEKTWYYEGDSIVRLQYNAGANGVPYERNYYYNSQNEEMVFAFVFLGQEEYRLYFYKNSLVRYIGPDGAVVDNPVESAFLEQAEQAVFEAYNQ